MLTTVAVFLEDGLRLILTGATANSDSELHLQCTETVGARRNSAANLLLGYGVADADVHNFNHLGAFRTFNCKCE